jgi:RNase P subunit RPR2
MSAPNSESRRHAAKCATPARVDCPECHSPLGPDQYTKNVRFVQDDHSTRMELITDCECCGPRKSNWRLAGSQWELVSLNPRNRAA